MTLRTPLARVRGLGSAKHGAQHFWFQRASAVALVPLVVWFLASVVAYAGAGYDEVTQYLRSPIVAVLFMLMIVAAFYHLRLGVQVVIEDYIHAEGTKIALLLLLNFYVFTFGALAVFSLLRIAFTV